MGLRPAPTTRVEALSRQEFALMVRALTLIAGDGEAAADATQDAFLQAHRHWHRVSNLESTSAIAETLGVTEATVRSHLRDARLRLVRPLPEEKAG